MSQEVADFGGVRADYSSDNVCAAIAYTQPYDLWRCAAHDTHRVEIAVFRHNREVVRFSKCPYLRIVRAKIVLKKVSRAGEKINYHCDKARRQIRVKQQRHVAGTVKICRSRSAAKAKDARISSRVR